MEDNGAAAAADASATSVPTEKRVAIPAAAVAATDGEGDKAAEELLPAPALPCGPRKTGLHLFIMNIRCVRFLGDSCAGRPIMLVLC